MSTVLANKSTANTILENTFQQSMKRPKNTVDLTFKVPSYCPNPLCLKSLFQPQPCAQCPELKGVKMANRLSINTRIWCRRYLAVRDGNKCDRCGKVSTFQVDIKTQNPTTQNKAVVKAPTTQNDDMDIDHKDGNPRNWNPDNLRLLCPNCNRGIENARRSSKPHSANLHTHTAQELATNQRLPGRSSTHIAHAVIDYSNGTAQMQASFLFVCKARDYFINRIREQGYASKEDLIFSGAEVAGCSPDAAKSYLQKMTSSAGVFKEVKDMLGGTAITWKDHLQPPEDEKQKIGRNLE